MWTITEDDNSHSTHHSPLNIHNLDTQASIESQGEQELRPTLESPLSNPLSADVFTDEEFGDPAEYSHNFFAESPAPSPIVSDSREVFRSEKNSNNMRRQRPSSANHRENQTSDNHIHTRPASASNVRAPNPPKLSEKGKSLSFGQTNKVFAPLNDLKEQRRDLDQLPRSERLVRRMGSPLGLTLLQLDERDMLLARDESWHLSKGRIHNHDRIRKREQEKRKEVGKAQPSVSARPLTGNPRAIHTQQARRPLSASARVQRSEGWQDGSREKRVEWSEVSGVEEDDGDTDGGYGGLFDDRHHDENRPNLHREKELAPRATIARVTYLGSTLRTELRRRPLAEVWSKELDPYRRGFFQLPELVQAMSAAGLRCTVVEAEELLATIGQRGQVTLPQFQQFYRNQEDKSDRDTRKRTTKSAVSNSDLQTLLANLELRASKLKFPGDSTQEAQPYARSKVNKAKSKNTKGALKSFVLI